MGKYPPFGFIGVGKQSAPVTSHRKKALWAWGNCGGGCFSLSNRASSCTARQARPVSSLTSRTTAPPANRRHHTSHRAESSSRRCAPAPAGHGPHRSEMKARTSSLGWDSRCRGQSSRRWRRGQPALAGDERHRGRSQRLEAGDVEGIAGIGEPRLPWPAPVRGRRPTAAARLEPEETDDLGGVALEAREGVIAAAPRERRAKRYSSSALR